MRLEKSEIVSTPKFRRLINEMYDRLRMASSPFDNNYIFLIGKIDLEPFFLAKQIMNNQIEHDDIAIVKLPEAEMDMNFDEVCSFVFWVVCHFQHSSFPLNTNMKRHW